MYKKRIVFALVFASVLSLHSTPRLAYIVSEKSTNVIVTVGTKNMPGKPGVLISEIQSGLSIHLLPNCALATSLPFDLHTLVQIATSAGIFTVTNTVDHNRIDYLCLIKETSGEIVSKTAITNNGLITLIITSDGTPLLEQEGITIPIYTKSTNKKSKRPKKRPRRR